MTHPIPPGTRDVLPDEMRELRRLQAALSEVFERHGYGEVATPTIEYDELLSQGGGFGLEPPDRVLYLARASRAIRPQRGQMREFMQAGVELIGAPAPEGTAEVVEVLAGALDAVGLRRAIIGLGDADLYPQLLEELGVAGEAHDRIVACLTSHDHVALEAEVGDLDVGGEAKRTLLRLASLRGGPEVLEEAHGLGGEAVERATRRLTATYDELSARGVADRVSLDLGLLRDLGYYTGAILEVYDPALGHILGGGGRYDELMGRFGTALPAAGFALYLERVHIAQAEEERLRTREGS